MITTRPKNKAKFLLFILVICPLSGSIMVNTILVRNVRAYESDFDSSNFYLVRGDIIKNFKFESFHGTSIGSGGGVYDNRLKFEAEPTWEISEDFEMLYTHTVGDKKYYYYKIPFRNVINIYSNVPVAKAASKLEQDEHDYDVVDFEYKLLLGETEDEWTSEITHHHWDFGNIMSYNGQYNRFSGDLKMSFDIADSPLPNIFLDENGVRHTKEFDYIAVSSVAVRDASYGRLSEGKPSIQGVSPSAWEEQTNTIKDVSPETGRGDTYISINIQPNIRFSQSYVLNAYGESINFQSIDSSLNPEQKNGEPIYDPKNESKSMEDCAFYFNIGCLTPLVQEYAAELSWIYYDIVVRDYPQILPPFYYRAIDRYQMDQMAKIEPTALHVQNRYIQAEIEVIFNVWTSYQIEKIDYAPGDFNIHEPQEYDNGFVWGNWVDGYGGGDVGFYSPSFLDEFFGALFGTTMGQILMFIAIAGVCVVTFIIILKLVLRRRPTRIKVVRFTTKRPIPENSLTEDENEDAIL